MNPDSVKIRFVSGNRRKLLTPLHLPYALELGGHNLMPSAFGDDSDLTKMLRSLAE